MGHQTLRKWGRGLLGAVINSAAGAGSLVIVDPVDFSPFNMPGVLKLAKVSVALAIAGAYLYLRQHPLPEDDVELV